jgi:hypothetical protein
VGARDAGAEKEDERMMRLLMIPIVMIAGALLVYWIETSRDRWERNAEMRWLIRKNRKWERMIEEIPNRRMREPYATVRR